MERCKACGVGVPVSRTPRTINASTSVVQNIVLLVISSKIDFQDSLQHFKSSYVCKKCFQLTSTYQRVKSELANTEDKNYRLMKNLQFVWQSQGSQVTRVAKRPSNSETNVK